VVKPVYGLVDPVGPVGLDHLLAAQRLQVGVQAGPHRWRDHLGHGTSVELLADHRRPLDHGAFVVLQPLDPRRQQLLDRGRHRHHLGPAVTHVLSRRVMDPSSTSIRRSRREERVALGGVQDPVQQIRRQLGPPQHPLDERRLSPAASGPRSSTSVARRPGR